MWTVMRKRCLLLLLLSAAAVAQQRKPVAISVDTPDNDADCPTFETALKDAFAISPRHELVVSRVRDGAMLFTVSCLSLHDAHVLSVHYTIQAFDDSAKAKSDPLFSTQSTAHLLVINKSPENLRVRFLVSFDQSVKKALSATRDSLNKYVSDP
jgi:hypothetical protein